MTPPSRFSTLFITLYLALYLFAGLFTELNFIGYKPLPETLLDDFGHYQRALAAALNGQDPYAVRAIGPAFLYPPPALLAVELFSHFEPFALRALIYLAANIALLGGLVYGVARYYDYPIRLVWWWFPLAFGFAPFLELLHVGQINLLTLFGIFLLFWGEIPPDLSGFKNPTGLMGRAFLAGAGLALAIITKVTPILLLGYLLIHKRFKVIVVALGAVVGLILLALLRYGPLPFQVYPDVLQDMVRTFPLDLHSQSLVSKLAFASRQLQDTPLGQSPLGSFLAFAAANVPQVQLALTVYLAAVLIVSGVVAFAAPVGKQREPFFIVVNLGMMLAPNIMWYHHYVFILLPFLIWMAWARFKAPVTLWCLISLLLIQIDRFRLTGGLLIHLFGHLSILGIVIWQVIQVWTYAKLKKGGQI